MKKHFEYHQVIRKNYTEILKSFSEEQLHIIPKGYRNNIFWNVAHAIATQQSICYLLAGASPIVPIEFIKDFRKGTAPKENHKELYSSGILLDYIHTTTKKIQEDYISLKDLEYTSYTTQFGATFDKIEEAIKFNNIHEALHFGYILSLKNNIK